MIRLLAALFLIFSALPPALALTPEEQLDNPILEERAREISQQLRCLVCQNQSIDDSDADLARDLRIEVRSLLTQGLSDDEILTQIRATYGDYVLLNPPVSTSTGLLWATPFVLVILGGVGFIAMRRKTATSGTSPSENPEASPRLEPASSGFSNKAVLIGLALIITLTAGLYVMLGRPDLAPQPLAERGQELQSSATEQSAQDESLKKALNAAQEAATANPDSVEAHLRLAMIAAEANAFDLELDALNRALKLTGDSPQIKSIKAEALSRKAGGLVTIPARNLIAEVLQVSPEEPRALYLFGLAAYQDEDYLTALERWGKLQSLMAPTTPLALRLAENIADAAERAGVPIPQNTSPFAMAEGLSDKERDEMISGMVESLEARLADNPQDEAGWDRLINARQVLGDQDGMIRALIGAANAFPQITERQVIALEAIVLEQREADHINDALSLLDRINTLSPRGPQFLFFAGHFAVISGESDLAVSLWQELEAKMDDSNPLKSQLQDQIRSLQNP